MGINKMENARALFTRHSLDTMAETIHTVGVHKWTDIYDLGTWNEKG